MGDGTDGSQEQCLDAMNELREYLEGLELPPGHLTEYACFFTWLLLVEPQEFGQS